MSHPLYFVAIVPPDEIRSQIRAYQEMAAQRFDTHSALRSPPHITLIPPFRLADTQLAELSHYLQDFAAVSRPFSIRLSDFAAFPPRVIYVDVLPNAELKSLQQRLEKELQQRFGISAGIRKHPFTPHLTVAFKDLRRSEFPKAWAHFSSLSYQSAFKMDGITLLRHDGRQWQILSCFPSAQV